MIKIVGSSVLLGHLRGASFIAGQWRLLHGLLHSESLIGSGDDEDFVHPLLMVEKIDKKGRGVIASSDIRMGELLMRVRPLAWATSDKGTGADDDDDQGPDPLQLVSILLKDQSQKTKSWLQVLHRGVRAKDQPTTPLDALNALFKGSAPLPPSPIDDESVFEAVVMVNAFGDRFQDPVLSRLSQPPHTLSPFVGLWPAFPLLNHSCIPKAVHYCKENGILVVRASKEIKAGEEISISYLGGEEDCSPVALRQDHLSRRFGFKCTCPRCKLEESLSPSLTALLHNTHTKVKRLMPSFQSAVEEDDEVKLAALSSDLEMQSLILYEGLGEFIRSDLSRNFESSEGDAPEPYLLLEASIYELFQVIAIRDEIAGADKSSSLQNCLDILGAVSRGSEVDCFLSSRLLFNLLRKKKVLKDLVDDEMKDEEDENEEGSRSRSRGGDERSMDEAIQQAAMACEQAHRARYGALKKDELLKVMRLSDIVGRDYL